MFTDSQLITVLQRIHGLSYDDARFLAGTAREASPVAGPGCAFTVTYHAGRERYSIAVTPADPSPSDVAYDDMTRAWRNGDNSLAWSLADALLQYMANDGQPLTGPRSLYYVRMIHAYYAPI